MRIISIGTEIRNDLKVIKRSKLNNKEGWENKTRNCRKIYKKRDKDRQVDLPGLIIKTLQRKMLDMLE